MHIFPLISTYSISKVSILESKMERLQKSSLPATRLKQETLQLKDKLNEVKTVMDKTVKKEKDIMDGIKILSSEMTTMATKSPSSMDIFIFK